MHKRGNINFGVIISIFVLLIIFGALVYKYIQETKQSINVNDQNVLNESTTVTKDIFNKILAKLHIGVNKLSSDFEKSIEGTLANFTLVPRVCSFDTTFSCQDVRIDNQNNKIWFHLITNDVVPIIVTKVEARGKTNCNPWELGQMLKFNEHFPVTLDNCILTNQQSELLIEYNYRDSGLRRVARGTFTLTENK